MVHAQFSSHITLLLVLLFPAFLKSSDSSLFRPIAPAKKSVTVLTSANTVGGLPAEEQGRAVSYKELQQTNLLLARNYNDLRLQGLKQREAFAAYYKELSTGIQVRNRELKLMVKFLHQQYLMAQEKAATMEAERNEMSNLFSREFVRAILAEGIRVAVNKSPELN